MNSKKVSPRLLEQFQKMIEKVVELTVAEINRKMDANEWCLKENRWSSAFVDTRWTPDGGSRIAKLRIEMLDGSACGRVDMPFEARVLLKEIGKMKDNAFPEKWYGLKITFTPEGKFELSFNYDSDCVTDSQFFLS